MHFRFVLKQLGLLLLMLSAAMVFSGAWAVYDARALPDGAGGEAEAAWAFAGAIAIGVVFGVSLILFGRASGVQQLGRREALLLVALSWFVGAAQSALPFWLWAKMHDYAPQQDQAFNSFVNCYFEAMSGLTTTGATVLSQIPSIPDSLLLWRSFTHWLGGLGIVVLFVAVLPFLGVGGKRLFRIEATGPTSEGVTPRIQETARRLWFIYMGMTLAQILLLKVVGRDMSWFNAIGHTFATLATGGFSSMNESVGGFGAAVQWIVVLFMLLAGINFGIYHQILSGRFRQAFRNTEFRAYLGILLVAAVIIAIDIRGATYDLTTGQPAEKEGLAFARDAVFQTVSIQTTTGFCTANFDQWPFLSKAVLLALMYIGGCGGSTGGGIKVVRIVVAVKVMWAELERAFRPNVVRMVRVGQATIDPQQRLSIVAYVLGILFLTAIGTFLLTVIEGPKNMDGITAVTTVAATLNNIGPGFAKVGAVENYGWFSDSSKLLMCLFMAVGRLEVFAVMVIFMPRFWRAE